MHALIVYCHPEPHSFNGAMKDTTIDGLADAGYSVEVSDLYADEFDPVEHARNYATRECSERFFPLTEQNHAYDQCTLPSDVQREIARLERADLIILQFPLWWHAQPAMLKGWFDRVFVYGGLYSGKMRYDTGRFGTKRVICSVTTGAPAPTFGRHGRSGDIVRLLWPIHYSLYYLGLQVLVPNVIFGAQGGGLEYQDEQALQARLDVERCAWSNRVAALHAEPSLAFAGWDDWDEHGALRINHPRRWAD
ncbi:NAD(P)H dehydrogenase (quinone) [Halopseudomonas xinjiangensis]|uniref:NAD(P)H dehydrogenase (Quinone) n=1 Tax=Halopseudomonas xinjiangensis TaxID=487184 RepID=A0A1H1PAL0_9GAMM|nr:NAD(P)H-dependent oxidoreductase [Halopseudomonas xinjiangensis]SDS08252.1 NAD(P)H dehydrogenase (quinone) [Halopseudomonas xinjiangensis]